MQEVEQLTERELEIEKLIFDGLPNVEIAAICNIVEGTVKTHVQSILRKRLIDGGRCVLMAKEIKRLYQETQDLMETVRQLERELANINSLRTVQHSPEYGVKSCA